MPSPNGIRSGTPAWAAPHEWLALVTDLAAMVLLAWRRRFLLALAAVLAVVGGLLAFSCGAGAAALGRRAARSFGQRDLHLVGRVAPLPAATQGQGGAPGWRFSFDVEEAHAGPSLNEPPLQLPHRLLLAASPDCGALRWRSADGGWSRGRNRAPRYGWAHGPDAGFVGPLLPSSGYRSAGTEDEAGLP